MTINQTRYSLVSILKMFLFIIFVAPTNNTLTNDKLNDKTRYLSIVTFNAGLLEVNLLGYPIITPASFLNERLKSIPQALIDTKADIICLQEVYLKSHQDFVIDKLSLYYPYHALQRTKSLKINNGLMILSKYPLSQIKFYPFRDRGPIDEMIAAEKGILTAKVRYDTDNSFFLVNTHPTSGGFINKQDSKKIMHIRNRQITQAMDIAINKDSLSIIVGDFNAGPEIARENYLLLPKMGFIDSYLFYSKENKTKTLTTWSAENYLNKSGTHSTSISQRIDHIFISPALINKTKIVKSIRKFDTPIVVSNEHKVTLSDHYGVQTFLKLTVNK